MAVNVDIVYKTVLLILNQQQRGYMTPDEFNKTATQVQLTIFEGYASDLNQQYRLPDNDTEYGDRVKNIEQKLQFFQKYINNAAVPAAITGTNPFTIDLTVVTDLYRLGSVMYQGVQLGQYSQRNEVTQLFLSPLTQPTEKFPIYLYESGQIFVFPNTIITPNDINISYLATPSLTRWGYSQGALGQYIYDSTVYGANLLNNGGTLSNFTTPLAGGVIASYTPTFVTSGAGIGLVLSATVTGATAATITVTTPGTGFAVGDTITINANQLGGGSTGPVITLTAADFNSGSTFGSTNFELDISEQTEIILRILAYAGVIIQDPSIVQMASQAIAAEDANEKS
jgi:hypothetical protein